MKPTTRFPLTKEPEPATTAQVRPWVIRLARLGYIAKGTIFLVVGLLAAKATFALGGKLTDQVGTLQIIDHQPLGQLLLSLLAAGLLAHALWQGLLALLDPEQKGTTLAGLAMRIGFAISSVLYGGLAISAIRILWGAGDQNSEGVTEHLTAQVLAYPLGPWLVGLVGMGMVGLGLYQFYKVYTTRFLTELDWTALDRPTRWWVTGSGYLGHIALGVVLLLSGSFLLQAAVKLNPQLAGGIQQVLQTLARPPYSPWSVAAIAVGLVAYGCFTFTLACYAHCLFAYDPDQA
ncbi:MAG: DUF1206 domain-containing protein [Chloroflexi bacterium]|nr:DUF1206 domain-containing protein [Chloroflexota bacterium]